MNRFFSTKVSLIALTTTLLVSPAMAAGNVQSDSVFSTVMVEAPPQQVYEAIKMQRQVEAPPQQVYEAIKMQRQVDPARKQVSYVGAEAVIDENFSGLPVIGSAKCVYREIESSPRSIEYHLLSSDKFKRFEGCWTLTPVEGGRKTELRLSTYLDTGVHVPFARQITNNSVKKDVLRRLGRVKILAEASSVDVALHHVKAN